MAERVRVDSVDELENYCGRLIAQKSEIESLAESLLSDCVAQNSNWQDPQYNGLKGNIEEFVSNVKATTVDLEDSIAYIRSLISHLREIMA